jgi:hypothetical protein
MNRWMGEEGREGVVGRPDRSFGLICATAASIHACVPVFSGRVILSVGEMVKV